MARQRFVAEGKGYTRANLMVRGSNRPGPKDYFLGPNAEGDAHVDCSVLLVRK